MSSLLLTLGIAFFIVVLSVALLGLSWLIKGKSSIRPGTCGRDPTKNRDRDCETTSSCSLCHHDEEKPKKRDDDTVQ